MSNSAECWEFSGRRLPEKSSFSQTCSRLSRYLKEKGSFGDLSLEMTCKPDVVNGGFSLSRQPTMMNLFPCDASGIDSLTVQDVNPMDLFHRQSSFSSSSSSGTKEEVVQIKETNSVKPESQTAPPLTIFYGGQVVVFDDFPAEKAKEVIDFANEGSAKSITSFIAEVNNISHGDNSQNLTKNQKEIASSPNPVPNTSSLACELPIARRASLHRFLEKRKDRITSKAPYPIGR